VPDPDVLPENRALFSKLLGLSDTDLPLARACLLIAAEIYPNLDIDHYLSKLAQISFTAAERAGKQQSPPELIAGLSHYLFSELRFRGNVKEYFDPENSLINRVLERRTGIPLTLSVIYLEVGWYLGIPLSGVCFPGHFLVKSAGENGDVLIDPFGGGVRITEDECLGKLKDLYGRDAELRPEYFRPASKRQILTRVLNNLKNIYLCANEYSRALGVVEMLCLLNPRNYSELRERAFLYFQLEYYAAAVRDLETYLEHCPHSREIEAIQQDISQIRRMIN
jgi:regulator of sirC expression with transglutaminase-like and TPR domain